MSGGSASRLVEQMYGRGVHDVERLRSVWELRRLADEVESSVWDRAIERASDQGPTVTELGRAVGLNRQAAWVRARRRTGRS